MSSPGPARKSKWFRESFQPLLVGLVAVLVLAPLAGEWPLLTLVLISALLVSGVLVFARHRITWVAGIAGLAASLALRWWAHFSPNKSGLLNALAHLMVTGYLAFVTGMVFARVLGDKQVTRDTVFGAVCGYLLIGYVFGGVYIVLISVQPEALSFSGSIAPGRELDLLGRDAWALMYFSISTLTTLGYGDILPVSPFARSLAMLEVLLGQLYLAAIVARLVGALGTTPQSKP